MRILKCQCGNEDLVFLREHKFAIQFPHGNGFETREYQGLEYSCPLCDRRCSTRHLMKRTYMGKVITDKLERKTR